MTLTDDDLRDFDPGYVPTVIELLEAHMDRTPPQEIFERDDSLNPADYDPAVGLVREQFEQIAGDPGRLMALINAFVLVWQFTVSDEFDGLSHLARLEKLRAMLRSV
jgi:hypothetical protein